MIITPAESGIEELVVTLVLWLRLAIEAMGALVVALGVVRAVGRMLGHGVGAEDGFTGIRLTLARHLALALEFQLGADILSTAVAPSWEAIGKLGAIAVIRTALNFFLSREMREEAAPRP